MSFIKIKSAQTNFLHASLIDVEIDTTRGLNSFSIVGLPDKAIEESKDRVSGAIKNSGFSSPKNSNIKTIVSLVPSEIKKEGNYFDVAIALGYLLSTEQISISTENKIFVGALSLNGDLEPVRGILSIALLAKRHKLDLFVSEKNTKEACLVEGVNVYGIKNLEDLIKALDNKESKKEKLVITPCPQTEINFDNIKSNSVDMCEIREQSTAKRALEIAASGGHNIALYGPPGTGKTMLARAFSGILPQLSIDDILEVTSIYSMSGTIEHGEIVREPPFRSPHHTSSYVSIIGGGSNPRPGEVTLAHRGVLFLDEFPEFEKKVLESLRQPIEDRIVTVSRAKGTVVFPSNFILVGAMNPCPCGYRGSKQRRCTCTGNDIVRYERKLSGPIIDRIDMWIYVGEVSYDTLGKIDGEGESSEVVRERIKKARKIQKNRFGNSRTNSDIKTKELYRVAPLEKDVVEILNKSAEQLKLSARAYHRIVKIARTIADLDEKENIEPSHILEALQYRPKITD